jgi:dihydrolipoamide dehydrogenase
MNDKDISATMGRVFEKLGIEMHIAAAVEKMEIVNGQVSTRLKNGKTFQTPLAVVCTGRRPLSAHLGLEEAGVKLEKGFVVIDETCRTSVANIYAIGDVTGKVQLAHVASRQADVAVHNILGQTDREDYRIVPSAVYTHPEVGSVGLTLEQAQAQGLKARAAKFAMLASGMATAYGETTGFVKIIAGEMDEILGAHLVCPHAADIVQEIACMMKAECTLAEIEATIHGHPTFCEAVKETAESLLGHPLHG